MSAYLNRLLRKAALAGEVNKIIRLICKGACPSSKGRDRRDTFAIIDDLKDEKTRRACNTAVGIGLYFVGMLMPRDPNDKMYDDCPMRELD